MNAALSDDLVRILERDPTRSMDAATLYRRARRELGLDGTLDEFIAGLERAPARFRVLRHAALPVADWRECDREYYAEALAETGMGGQIVTLAEPCRWVPADIHGDDVFRTTHDSLTRLLASATTDHTLVGAIDGALAELRALRLAAAVEDYGPARRSSTLHHCSSTSSASTVKPAASAASRMSGASSTRMPDRIAQPPSARAR